MFATCKLPGGLLGWMQWCSEFFVLLIKLCLHLEDSIPGSVQSGRTEHIAARGVGTEGTWVPGNEDLVLVF